MSMSLTAARELAATGTVSDRAARILAAVNAKGAFVSATTRTPVATTAAHRKNGTVVEKLKTVNCTTGVEYSHLAQNQGKETGALPNGQEWAIYPWISRSADGQTEYFRMYIDFRTATIRNEYFVDSVSVGKGAVGREAIKQYLTPGAIAKLEQAPDLDREPVATLGVKVSNVLAVNGQTI